MSTSTSKLTSIINSYKAALKRKDAENKRLRSAIRVLLAQNEGDDAPLESEVDMLVDEGACDEKASSQTDEESAAEEEGDDDGLPESIQANDGLYYCPECLREIEEGCCWGCGTVYQWLVDDDEFQKDSISTLSEALHPDRSLVPRGDTPLREIDDAQLEAAPAGYRNSITDYRLETREAEYAALLQRGATPLMCETFHLEFSYDHGIYAYADAQIFEEFSGDLMRPGDEWKIYLGRRISLDVDDLDGSGFIEGLLEDALLYQRKSNWALKRHERWQTVREAPGVWVTRPQAWATPKSRDRQDDDDDADSAFDAITDFDADDRFRYDEVEDEILETSPEDDLESAIRPDQYSISDDDDDDGEEEECGMDYLGFFNPEGRDSAWIPEAEDVDQLAEDDHDDGEYTVPMDPGPPPTADLDGAGDMLVVVDDHEDGTDTQSASDTLDDSDEAGSDFDSNEELSGDDEQIIEAEAFLSDFDSWQIPLLGRGSCP